MKDGARAQAAIEVLDALAARPAPADVVAGAYFKSRRYIGSKDRAAIAGMVYGVLRRRAPPATWPGRVGAAAPGPRLRVVAWLALAEGWTMARLDEGFESSPFRPARLEAAERAAAAALAGQTLDHSEQPPSVRRN